ncbi:hypothetical protein INT48_006650 [Thamnidium elegans]|uniref:Uncharacterized protein n=1 Tax=Thamnidium elegans TaxID=101142 RepID=A0A8H7VWQ0_9FUNG|nr:hypothetical protein INT48_006650 [Thamnidium elegans]
MVRVYLMISFDDSSILILDEEREEDQSFSLPDLKEHFSDHEA